MAQLLDRIHGEIRERLQTSRAAVEEYAVLEALLGVLGGPVAEPEPTTARREHAAVPRAAKPPRAARKPSAERAPRGANRAAVLRVLGERPGVSVTELAAASGVAKPVLYNLLGTLAKRDEVVAQNCQVG
jgi:hypothetical protein